MRKINYLFLFFVGIMMAACVNQDDDMTLDQKVIPDGSREVKVNIDPSYDLSNTIAYGKFDSLAMNASSRSLAVPSGSGDIIYFVDKDSRKVKAVASFKSFENEVTVNAETVTAALHDIVPSYLGLSAEDRAKFNETAPSLPAYRKLVSTVDQLLKSGESVYSPIGSYVADLRAVSSYISENFETQTFGQANARTTVEDLRYWIKDGSPLRIANQSYTYVTATFTPADGGAAMKYLLNPRPITFDYSQESIKEFNKPDGYYYLKLSQNTAEARERNEYGFANNVLNMSLGANYWDMVNGDGGEECFHAIMDYIQDDLQHVYDNPPTDFESAYVLAMTTAIRVLPGVLGNNYCIQFFSNNEAQIHIMTDRILMLFEVLEEETFLQEMGGFAFYFESLYIPFEFENRIKIEDGAIKW